MNGVNLYREICMTFLFVGVLFGFLFFGIVADTFGRKISITMAIFLTFVGSFLGPLVVHPWAYAVTWMIKGVVSQITLWLSS